MKIPLDIQIESLCEAHDRAMSRLHLGASPYDDDDLPDGDSHPPILEINDRDE